MWVGWEKRMLGRELGEKLPFYIGRNSTTTNEICWFSPARVDFLRKSSVVIYLDRVASSTGRTEMPIAISRSSRRPSESQRTVRPSISPPKPFQLDQELEQFGSWTGQPIWVPPKDSSAAIAESMLDQGFDALASRERRWSYVTKQHREHFTQVREIDLVRSSIRLPKGKFFVSVTEQKDFDKIEEDVPACVQARLDEFLAGPGRRVGVRLYYLKPLCVEMGDDLILTTREDLDAAIERVREEVFREFRRMYFRRLPKRLATELVNLALALPRSFVQSRVRREQQKLEAYHAKLEFNRRQTALLAAETHRKCRTDGCTYNQMLALTNPLQTDDVIEQFGAMHELSRAHRDRLMLMAAGTVPWFVSLSITVAYLSTLTWTSAAPVAMVDPAFVAEMPGARGKLLKIGHFDEIGGVTHVEI